MIYLFLGILAWKFDFLLKHPSLLNFSQCSDRSISSWGPPTFWGAASSASAGRPSWTATCGTWAGARPGGGGSQRTGWSGCQPSRRSGGCYMVHEEIYGQDCTGWPWWFETTFCWLFSTIVHNLAQLLCHCCSLWNCLGRIGQTAEQQNWNYHNLVFDHHGHSVGKLTTITISLWFKRVPRLLSLY